MESGGNLIEEFILMMHDYTLNQHTHSNNDNILRFLFMNFKILEADFKITLIILFSSRNQRT